MAVNEEYNLDYNLDFTSPDGSTVPTDGSAKLKYTNTHIIYEKIIKCTIPANQLNGTYNPTILTDPKDPYSDIKPIFINNDFTPYATTIGLYNDANELLAVAKFNFPIKMPKHTDITFVIRIDF